MEREENTKRPGMSHFMNCYRQVDSDHSKICLGQWLQFSIYHTVSPHIYFVHKSFAALHPPTPG